MFDDLEPEELEVETPYNRQPRQPLGDSAYRTLPAPTE